MKIFFDTEFFERMPHPGLPNLLPISVGMVREDGAEYYAVHESVRWASQTVAAYPVSSWLVENVWRHLGPTVAHAPLISRLDILEFCGDKPEFWADYGSYDWVVLAQLFGTMMDLPKGWPMFVRDFQQHIDDIVISIDGNYSDRTSAGAHLDAAGPVQDPATLHHALHDARHLKAQYDFIQSCL